MKRILYTALACAAFLAMLTGTSKKREPREAGSIPKLTIPATTGWARNEMAGIRFMSPPNTVVERGDELAAIRIKFTDGTDVSFLPQATPPQVGHDPDFTMYDAPDAHIYLFEYRSNDVCNVTACTTMPIMGSPLCIRHESKRNDDCAQIVALVRSIQPL